MAPSGKWIEGLCADCTVEDAARRSLESRLSNVAHWLPLAAHLAEHDIEHVHRLRVSTRRAMAALKLYRDWLPSRPGDWFKRRLKKIRRAAGSARDLDVLGERMRREHGHRAAPVLTRIASERAAAQSEIVEVAERSRRDDRFVRRMSDLLDRIEPPGDSNVGPRSFRDWAGEKLAAVAGPFFSSLPSESADAAALHQFRIRGKAVRYAIELLAPALDPLVRKELYPQFEELQERLGQINDHASARDQLLAWIAANPDAGQRSLYGDLLCDEVARMKRGVHEFKAWWTPQRAEALRAGLGSHSRPSSPANG